MTQKTSTYLIHRQPKNRTITRYSPEETGKLSPQLNSSTNVALSRDLPEQGESIVESFGLVEVVKTLSNNREGDQIEDEHGP